MEKNDDLFGEKKEVLIDEIILRDIFFELRDTRLYNEYINNREDHIKTETNILERLYKVLFDEK